MNDLRPRDWLIVAACVVIAIAAAVASFIWWPAPPSR